MTYRSVLMLFIVLLVGGGILGTVMLIPSGTPPSLALTYLSCWSSSDAYERLECMRPIFTTITNAGSPQTALDYVLALQEHNIIGDCHLPAHWIGEAHLDATENLGLAYATCAEGCVEGCQHGVIEAHIARHGFVPDGATLCEPLGSGDPLQYRQCLHGYGHAMMRINTGAVEAAIAACEAQDSTFATETCLGGVGMEYVEPAIERGRAYVSEAFPSLCADTPSEFHRRCVRESAYAAMVVTGYDVSAAHKLCGTLPPDDQKICMDGVAREEATAEASINRHLERMQ